MSAIFNRITHIITIFIVLIVLVTCHVTSLQQRHSNISAYFHNEIDFGSGIRSYRVLGSKSRYFIWRKQYTINLQGFIAENCFPIENQAALLDLYLLDVVGVLKECGFEMINDSA